jgi:hypothetical protein
VTRHARPEIIYLSRRFGADGIALAEIQLNSGERLFARGRTPGEVSCDLVLQAKKRGWKLEEMGPTGSGLAASAENYEKQLKRSSGGRPASPEFDFTKAFQEGRTLQLTTKNSLGPVKISVVRCGELVLPTGRIVACDPFIRDDTEELAFRTRVPPGKYPVLLSVATSESIPEFPLNSCVMLRFRNANPVRWEQAFCKRQDPANLEPTEIFRYAVNSGVGCFMSIEAARVLLPHIERFDSAIASGRYRAFVVVDPAPHLNVIAFSSGWGDGRYSSFFGYDASGKPACLVTDFSLLDPAVWQ